MTIHEYFLGQIFWQPEIIAKTIVEPEDIPTSRDRAIFEAMKQINYEGEIINERSVHDTSGIQLDELLKYKDSNIIVSQWKYYETQIIEQSRQANIRKAAEKILNGRLSADDMISEFTESITTAKDRTINVVRTLGECIDISLEEFSDRMKNNTLPGVSTGFRKLDELFGGFQRRRLYYVGARPSQGKSTLLMNFAMDFKRPLAFFTAESADIELSNRMLIRRGRLVNKQFMSGVISRDDFKRLGDASEQLYNKDMHVFYEGGMPIQRLVSLAYELKRTKRIEGIFIDYIQLLDPLDKSVPRHEQVSEVSRRLKQLSIDLDLPVICAAQLRRDSSERKPRLDDFSDSTQIERDADVAMMIYNIRKEGSPKIESSFLCVEKNRDGELKDVQVDFQPEHYHFQERLPSRYEEGASNGADDW